MTLDPDRVTTVTFDSYSTVVDVDSATRALAEHTDDPEAVAGTWRGRSLSYASMSNYLGSYEPFWEMVRRGLSYARDAHGVDLTDGEFEDVLSVYHDLDAFEDVRPGMERLVEMGYDLYIVSNGSPDMLESMVESAGVADLLWAAGGVAFALFALTAVVQLVVLGRALERGTEEVAETAAELETAAEAVEATAADLEETADTVESAAAAVDDSVAEEVQSKAAEAKETTETVKEQAGEVKETAESERERLPADVEPDGDADER